MQRDTPKLRYAKQLRTNQTEAEQKLWYHLRGHRFFGLKFKRQKPIGPYIVDFVCLEHGLVIELDGGQHNAHPQPDRERDAYFVSRGLTTLRFWNNEVINDTDAVLEKIRLSLHLELPLPRPSPARGRGTR